MLLSINPMDLLKDQMGEGYMDTSIRGTVGSMYQLFMAIGVIGIFLTLVLCALRLALEKNPGKRADVFEELKWKAVLAVVLFGMSYFVGLLVQVAMQIGKGGIG